MRILNIDQHTANDIARDFTSAAKLANIELALQYEFHPAPHIPPILPKGKLAVYAFIYKGECLKVGKAGMKSKARFTSQHYLPNASISNLAKSILQEQSELGLSGITEDNVGEWIKSNVDRISYFIEYNDSIFALNLLESFVQCRLKPRFEGFKSQR
jgi:hypothetical protein